MASDVLQLTPHESVTLISRTDECLEVEATYAGRRGRPVTGIQSKTSTSRCSRGRCRSRSTARRERGAVESIEIPRGRTHRLWNDHSEPARVVWRTSPAGRTEQWFRAIDAIHRHGRVGRSGMPSPLAFGVLLSEYRDVLRLAGPDALLRPAFSALGGLGRARGYSAFDGSPSA